MIRDTPPSQDASTHKIFGFLPHLCRRYAQDTISLQSSEVKVNKVIVTPKMVQDSLPSQYAYTYQICNAYLK